MKANAKKSGCLKSFSTFCRITPERFRDCDHLYQRNSFRSYKSCDRMGSQHCLPWRLFKWWHHVHHCNRNTVINVLQYKQQPTSVQLYNNSTRNSPPAAAKRVILWTEAICVAATVWIPWPGSRRQDGEKTQGLNTNIPTTLKTSPHLKQASQLRWMILNRKKKSSLVLRIPSS